MDTHTKQKTVIFVRTLPTEVRVSVTHKHKKTCVSILQSMIANLTAISRSPRQHFCQIIYVFEIKDQEKTRNNNHSSITI